MCEKRAKKAIINGYGHTNNKCLQSHRNNFRLGGIVPIIRAVPFFKISMRLTFLVACQKGNGFHMGSH